MRCLGVALGVALGCGAPTPRTIEVGQPVDPADLTYRVTVDEALEELGVTACFRSPAPGRLRADHSLAPAVLKRAVASDGRPLARRGSEILLGGLGTGECVHYAVDLGAAVELEGRDALRRGDAVLLKTGLWLWGPSPRSTLGDATLRFELPRGVVASVPWEPRGEEYVVDETTFGLIGQTAIGRAPSTRLEVAGAEIEIVRFPGELALSRTDLEQWIRRSVEAVAGLYGRAPYDRLLVNVVPTGAGSGPVAFGFVTRGGGISVMLLVRSNARLEDFARDWVTVHELAHAVLPAVRQADAWFSEGVATYYQEVLRARAGIIDPERAWAALDDGFRRGLARRTGRTMRRESADMHQTQAYEAVYWFGALYALMADVELRRAGASLDEAVSKLRDCCLRSARAWSAERVISALDERAGTAVLRRLADRTLDAPGYPDIASLYAFLGLVRDGRGGIALEASAPGVAIRDAIMGVPGAAGRQPDRAAR
jgi:hypothetical protein